MAQAAGLSFYVTSISTVVACDVCRLSGDLVVTVTQLACCVT